MAKPVHGRHMIDLVKAAGLAPENTRRVVIDCSVDDVVRVYAELYGTEDLLKLELPDPASVEVVVCSSQ